MASPGDGDDAAMVAAYVGGMSLTQVARAYRSNISAVRKAVLASGAMRGRANAVRLCAGQGRLGSGFRGKRREFTTAHRDAISAAATARGEREAAGTSLKPNGYVEFTRGPNKGRGQHRVVMEARIGRRLKASECVHHRDGNRSNNAPENLEVMTRAEHARHHALELHPLRERDNRGRFK